MSRAPVSHRTKAGRRKDGCRKFTPWNTHHRSYRAVGGDSDGECPARIVADRKVLATERAIIAGKEQSPNRARRASRNRHKNSGRAAGCRQVIDIAQADTVQTRVVHKVAGAKAAETCGNSRNVFRELHTGPEDG